MRIVSLLSNSVKFSVGSKRSLLLAVIAVSIAALAFVVPRFVLPPSSANDLNSAKPKKQQGCCSNMPATLRRMIGSYYTTEDGFKSTLILNNKGPNQIMVTPILHSQNGQMFAASLVAVGGQSSQEVDLNTLASIAGPQFRTGSFEFIYEGRMLEVGGGLRIVDSEKSLIFDEQMLEPGMKFPSSRLEAVYAVPFEDSQASVIVTNTTAQPVNVDGDAIFAGANGRHPVKGNLGPYETKIVNLPRGLVKKASAGAVSLNHNGAKGALLAMIHLQAADRGYSESVNFTNPTGGKTTERHGAGLRLGSVNNDSLKPVIAVRNIGNSATTVTATVPYSKQNGDTGTIALPQLILAPGEIKLLNTSNPQLRRNDFATAGLEIKYTGAPGSVIASATSVSQSGNHVFALPVKDPQGGLSSTGGYPWFITETSSTIVFIKNVTNEPQEFMLDIIYPGGHWGSKLRTLARGQTFKLDVKKVRDTQEKGSDGSLIPLDATSGHVFWSVSGNRNKTLIGRAQMVDTTKGLVSSYECQCVCPSSFSECRLLPESISGFPGDTQQFLPQARYQNCYGVTQWFDVNVSQTTLSSDNPGVATINSSGLGTALAPGTTYLRGSWSTGVYSWDSFLGTCVFEPLTAEAEASCDVQPPCQGRPLCHSCSASGTSVCDGMGNCLSGLSLIPLICDQLDLTYTSPQNLPCFGVNCGAGIQYNITGVTHNCASVDLAGAMVTETITTDNGCGPGGVVTGPGCPVGSGNAISDCVDEYRLCLDFNSIPGAGCTEIYTQKIFVGSCLAETRFITFTIVRGPGQFCGGTVTRE